MAPKHEMQWKKETLFWPGRNAQNGLKLHTYRFLDVLIPMAQVLKLYILITTIAIGTPKNLQAGTFKWFQAVLPGQKQLFCVFLRNKYGSQIGNAMEEILYFDQEDILKMAWNFTYRFLDVPIPMAQVLRLYIQIFLSYGLYVCIILETAHHRGLLLEYFAHYSKYYTWRKYPQNVPYFFTNCTFSLWQGQGHLGG